MSGEPERGKPGKPMGKPGDKPTKATSAPPRPASRPEPSEAAFAVPAEPAPVERAQPAPPPKSIPAVPPAARKPFAAPPTPTCETLPAPAASSSNVWALLWVRGVWFGFGSAVILAVLTIGLDAGDITPPEAVSLTAARTLLSGAAAEPESTSYAHVLALVHRTLGWPVSQTSAWMVAWSFLLMTVAVSVAWAAGVFGGAAAVAAGTVVGCSLPALWLSTTAGPDAGFAAGGMLATMGSWRLFSLRFGSYSRLVVTAWAVAAVLAVIMGVALATAAAADSAALQRWAGLTHPVVGPLLAALLVVPVLAYLEFLMMPGLTAAEPPAARLALRLASVGGFAGLAAAWWLPGLWLGCGLLASGLLAVVAGWIWQRYLDGRLSAVAVAAVGGRLLRHTLLLCSLAMVVGGYRALFVFPNLEMMAGLCCAGFYAAVLAWLLSRDFAASRPWLRAFQMTPMLMVAVTLKLAVVLAWLPERDQIYSPRGEASAVRRLLPPDATVYTNTMPSPDWRWYLDRPIHPVIAHRELEAIRPTGSTWIYLRLPPHRQPAIPGITWDRTFGVTGSSQRWLGHLEPGLLTADRQRAQATPAPSTY